MVIHKFSDSLNHERNQTLIADNFYKNVLEVTDIIRFNSDSEFDMQMQKQDVDLLLKRKGITFRVSEKFRDKDFGDLYIEVYSKYPNKLGWLHTGTPNSILYFTPKNVYWITHLSLKSCCFDKIFPLIPTDWYNELSTSTNTILTKKLAVESLIIPINLIKAYNFDGSKWETYGISIDFDILEKLGVKIKKFSL